MEAAIRATNQGVDGFLTKPFDNVELRAKIREISVRKRLKQFVPEQVYKEIESLAGSLKPTFHEVSVLFSDIRGFTRMSQKISPEAIAAFLNNHYFAPMGEIVYKYKGTVDKHIGDSIMVVFGAPVSQDDDAIRAVKSAIAMQKEAKKIDNKLKRNGLRLKIGIGISTGNVFSGVLGSLRKKEFTSIGMAVNIAARLQSMAKKDEILISESTFQKISDQNISMGIDAEVMPAVKVKGIDEPITAYRVK